MIAAPSRLSDWWHSRSASRNKAVARQPEYELVTPAQARRRYDDSGSYWTARGHELSFASLKISNKINRKTHGVDARSSSFNMRRS